MPGIRLSLAILALGASTTACSPGEDVTTPAAEAPDSADAPARYDAEAFFTTTSYSLAGGYAWSSDDTRLAGALPMKAASSTRIHWQPPTARKSR